MIGGLLGGGDDSAGGDQPAWGALGGALLNTAGAITSEYNPEIGGQISQASTLAGNAIDSGINGDYGDMTG